MSSSSSPTVIGASTSNAERVFAGHDTADTSPLVRLFTLPGVFRPRSDSWMLVRALRAEGLAPGARVLDVCTGSGLLAIAAAQLGARATAIDVSRRAVVCAALNARLNGVRVRALRGDLLAPVRGERFDAIVSNPPYLPAADDELPARGAARAWEAGRDGRALLDALCSQAPVHLAPGGVLLVVHSELSRPDRTIAMLRDRGLDARATVRHRGTLGPLMRSRAGMLEARGLLAPGASEEEVVIVRGTHGSAHTRSPQTHAEAQRREGREHDAPEWTPRCTAAAVRVRAATPGAPPSPAP